MSKTVTDSDLQLLARYTRDHSETAFAELVRRHLDLIHSAALRQVRSPQLAEEVAQSVFTDLARNASRLQANTVVTAWLYQVTRRTAIDVVRREARRQLREQIATEMNAMNVTPADWTHIEPLLDEAMSALDETDRAAVLLRYFENKSLREVGATLGTSDDAAQKRVSRAVERLREYFTKRGVTVGASGLAVVLSANAVQAAPVGLALTISTAAVLTGTTLATTATITATKAIVMTTLQKTLVTATITILAGVSIYEARQAAHLRDRVEALQQQQAPLAGQIEQLERAHGEATNQFATLAGENDRLKQNAAELLRLRGEVARLRRSVTEKSDSSSQSKLLSFAREEMQTQATNTILREVQKLKDELGLTPEQAEALRKVRFKYVEAHARRQFGEFAGDVSAEERETLNHSFAMEKAEAGAILTPEQQAAHEQSAKDQQSKWATNSATAAVAKLKESLNLTSEQQAALIPVLTQFGPVNALATDAQSQFDARLRALESILTPEQLQTYRQQKQEELERATKMKQALLGN